MMLRNALKDIFAPAPVVERDLIAEISEGKFLGIAEHLEAEKYHKAPYLSFTGLTHFESSPAHYQAYVHTEKEQTDAMRIGTLTHLRILEPELFKTQTALIEGNGNSKDVKEAIKQAETEGKVILRKREEMDLIDGMADAIYSHPVAREIFRVGKPEVSCFGIHEPTGVKIKARFDWWRPVDGIIADLKTCRPDVLLSDRALRGHIYESRYHYQSAFYLGLASAHIGERLRLFTHVFVGNKPTLYLNGKLTFDVRVKVLGDASLDKAVEQYTPLIERFAECQRSGEWPGPTQEIETVQIPDYAW